MAVILMVKINVMMGFEPANGTRNAVKDFIWHNLSSRNISVIVLIVGFVFSARQACVYLFSSVSIQ